MQNNRGNLNIPANGPIIRPPCYLTVISLRSTRAGDDTGAGNNSEEEESVWIIRNEGHDSDNVKGRPQRADPLTFVQPTH
jgi:hypothetical protein